MTRKKRTVNLSVSSANSKERCSNKEITFEVKKTVKINKIKRFIYIYRVVSDKSLPLKETKPFS